MRLYKRDDGRLASIHSIGTHRITLLRQRAVTGNIRENLCYDFRGVQLCKSGITARLNGHNRKLRNCRLALTATQVFPVRITRY